MRIAYIMRGVSGSGKTTVAKQLIQNGGTIHATDNYFMVEGVYTFDPAKLSEYHELNFQSFSESLQAGVPVIVCDNTNILYTHYQRYVEAAEQAGYLVAIVTLPHPDPQQAAERNLHGVPLYAIDRQISRFE
ncbi:MAG: ATP-binding protein [Patescibacteria group bacterium]|jgi:predicted kinase